MANNYKDTHEKTFFNNSIGQSKHWKDWIYEGGQRCR
jgi:hypothetical protein